MGQDPELYAGVPRAGGVNTAPRQRIDKSRRQMHENACFGGQFHTERAMPVKLGHSAGSPYQLLSSAFSQGHIRNLFGFVRGSFVSLGSSLHTPNSADELKYRACWLRRLYRNQCSSFIVVQMDSTPGILVVEYSRPSRTLVP